ncbi:MAG: hypothetical protein PWQ85_867 [Geotoga sp.]|nr:hypothetical protein [Geotoga sp.]
MRQMKNLFLVESFYSTYEGLKLLKGRNEKYRFIFKLSDVIKFKNEKIN